MIATLRKLLGSVAIGAFAASGALAQSTAETTDTTVDTQGGQVVVEQEDATVNVTVPDPNVEVTQGQPVVTVEQPQSEITVRPADRPARREKAAAGAPTGGSFSAQARRVAR